MFKSSNKFSIVGFLFIIIFATACSNQAAGADITEITWRWSALVETEPASQSVVPDPENYTLILKKDGTLSLQADCNMVNGTYTLDGNSLTIELGPSTMAFCGEQSLDLKFLEMLNLIENYMVESDQLLLNLENDAGRMTFNK